MQFAVHLGTDVYKQIKPMVQKNIEESNTYAVEKQKDTTEKIKILRKISVVET